MIKSLTVTNFLGESIVLELGRPEKSGFIIESIEGLGPCTATINAKEQATADGAIYNSARVNSRNIVLSLKFLFAPTIEDVRQKSYKYFPIKKPLTLKVETYNRTAEIQGYVESNEPDIFSKDEGTQISIICPDPYFYSTRDNVTWFSGVEAIFEFPFSNDSLTEKLLEFGRIEYATERVVRYSGDADVGVRIFIHALGDVSNITIYNTGTRETMKIFDDFVNADDIYISTIKGDKYIYRMRNGVFTNILNSLSRDSNWFTLSKGDNIFAFTADVGSGNLQFRIENRTVYEGV